MGKYIDVQVSTGITSGLTSADGTVVKYPAIVKYKTEFPMAGNEIMVNRAVFRNRELFEKGYQGIEVLEFEKYKRIDLTDDEMENLSPFILASKITEDLNIETGYTGSTKGFVVVTGSTQL